ncbi:hypothetical protein OROHE_003789 [Orobanche hederae]
MSASNARRRNLPSWMSSREEENDDSEKSKQSRNHGKSIKDQNTIHLDGKGEEESPSVTSAVALDFSKCMEGIVFVLSGFVNPDRGTLRSQMLEMGAEYQPDWNSNCTLLVCAFSNTPKFRQVKAEGGTIISKDWILECYNQRKLVDIEPFLLHAGKPWRRQSISHEAREDIKPFTSSKSLKQEDKSLYSKKAAGSSKMKGCISPSKAKKWAVEDLNRTISWLGSRDEKLYGTKNETFEINLEMGIIIKKYACNRTGELSELAVTAAEVEVIEDCVNSSSSNLLDLRIDWGDVKEWCSKYPEPSEIKKIAAEGILTCIQDAIDALKQGRGIQSIAEQWACLPRAVEELAQFVRGKDGTDMKDLCREAMACKQIYELEFLNLEHEDIAADNKRPQSHGSKKVNKRENVARDDTSYDSDATIEMTEEEIDQAYNNVVCSL